MIDYGEEDDLTGISSMSRVVECVIVQIARILLQHKLQKKRQQMLLNASRNYHYENLNNTVILSSGVTDLSSTSPNLSKRQKNIKALITK